MKKILFTALLVFSFTVTVSASSPARDSIKVSSLEAARTGSEVTVSFELEVGKKAVPRGYSLLLIPAITNGEYEWALQPVVAQARRARIAEERHVMASGPVETDNPAIYTPTDTVLRYSVAVPYQEWMNGASLEIAGYRAGCGLFDELDKIVVHDKVKPVSQ